MTSSLEDRFRDVVREYAPALWRMSRGYEHDADKRKDLHQDMLVAIWRALPSFEGRSSLRTFVLRVAHNTACAHVAKNKRFSVEQLVPLDDVEIDWGYFQGTVAASSTARTGTGSCLVCTDNSDTYFTADDDGPIKSPAIGKTFRVEVWVRTAPGKPIPPDIFLTLRSRNDTPVFATPEATDNALNAAPTTTWQKLATELVITKPAQSLNVVVAGNQATDACFLLDDVVVYEVGN